MSPSIASVQGFDLVAQKSKPGVPAAALSSSYALPAVRTPSANGVEQSCRLIGFRTIIRQCNRFWPALACVSKHHVHTRLMMNLLGLPPFYITLHCKANHLLTTLQRRRLLLLLGKKAWQPHLPIQRCEEALHVCSMRVAIVGIAKRGQLILKIAWVRAAAEALSNSHEKVAPL